ncbi:MAG TPA: dihydrofolate reductase family protein, partial [Candidatus Thermoplasmatota archaeon]|nr:dihydrofolate reductase family protein [Candidatus Thermoplasmatota archaeon]
VLDSQLRTPPTARVLDGRAPTVIYTNHAHAGAPIPGAEVKAAGEYTVDLARVLADLEARGVRSLMVEGGARVLASFLREGLWDEMTVYIAPLVVGDGAPSFAEGRVSDGLQGRALTLTTVARLGEGVLHTYHPRKEG